MLAPALGYAGRDDDGCTPRRAAVPVPLAVIVVTTETAAGYRVERSLEMVWGEAHSRTQAVEAMEQAARALEANGIVGVRWATAGRGPEEARLYFVYGTASILQAVEAGE
jgi:uncharacterized protein YbjQ (UPF0145 family)